MLLIIETIESRTFFHLDCVYFVEVVFFFSCLAWLEAWLGWNLGFNV
jgi:hypothetical protein